MRSQIVLSRLHVLSRILATPRICRSPTTASYVPLRLSSESSVVTINDVTKQLKKPKHPELVPVGYLSEELPQSMLKHLRWLLQKDQLGQDVFLIGPPGPLRRLLALSYLQLTKREVEFVTLTRDTTDTDLKQRREIRGGTSFYHDQNAVRAAVEGRVLVLEGIEKAERNVLPVLNNLLENREMQLEDGRLLISSSRYDKLIQEHSQEELDRMNLVRVDEDFRVIALGLPSPPYQGHPLDPPLRSRFQARDVSSLPYKEHLQQLLEDHPGVSNDIASRTLSLAHTILTQECKGLGLPDFPIDNLASIMTILSKYPEVEPTRLINRLYPYHAFLPQETYKSVEELFSTFGFNPFQSSTSAGINEVRKTQPLTDSQGIAEVTLQVERKEVTTQVFSGNSWGSPPPPFVFTPYHHEMLTEIIQSHSVKDMCIIGPRGCGKSAVVSKIAHMLGYQTEPILVYQDMTSRDLVQQRVTSANGDTAWQFSPLVNAALEGKMAILDGIHRLHHGTLAVLHRLIHDRELQLYDGTRLLHSDRFDLIKKKNGLSHADMTARGIYRIHPSFRIVALAEPPVIGAAQGQWLTPEALTLFLYHNIRRLSSQETISLVNKLVGDCSPPVEQLITLASKLSMSTDPALRSLAESLSLRQIIRIAKRFRAYPAFDLHSAVYKACLARFLPPLAKQALDSTLENRGITKTSNLENQELICEVEDGVLRIGNTHAQVYVPETNTKVPNTLFFDIHQHVAVLENMLQDWLLGDHLLLVGNQGVGKNKLADRFLYLLSRPREYIQLHRDTTVQSLTIQPVVQDGRIQHEDSPLVVAVKTGHVLVVDEADKAPTHVTCVLKTLVESGEMLLSDGRRIVPNTHPLASADSPNIIISHPDFRMIVLANRPGFPFLGNDFFGSLGDLFSCHAIDNPSVESEMSLLRSYGPDVPEDIMRRLVGAFSELRDLADQALIQYPYSTREVVNIIKHLQEFPNDGVASVIRNVVDFDTWSGDAKDTLIRVMHHHGIPVGTSPNSVNLAKKLPLPEPKLTGMWQVARQRPKGKTALIQLPVESSSIRLKGPVQLSVFHQPVDVTEARSAVFTEQQSYWPLPLYETALVTDIAVSPGGTQDPLDDCVHVATVAPAAVYSFVPRGRKHPMKQVLLQDVLPRYRSAYQPRLRMSHLPNKNLLIHEETSNTLMTVDMDTGSVTCVQLNSMFEAAAETLLKRLGSGGGNQTFFRMCKNKLEQWQLTLWEVGGGRLLFINLLNETLHTVTLPIIMSSLHLLDGTYQLLAVDKDGGKWLLKDNINNFVLHPVIQTPNEQDSSSLNVSCIAPPALSDFVLSSALGQQISAPSRLMVPPDALAAVAVGFPELDASENEIYVWERENLSLKTSPTTSDPTSFTVLLKDAGQVVRAVDQAPKNAFEYDTQPSGDGLFLEITDLVNHSLSYVPVPRASQSSPYWAWTVSSRTSPLFLAATSGQGIATVDSAGVVRLWQTGSVGLQKALTEWRKMIGEDTGHLRLEFDRFSGEDTTEPKHGKEDPSNAPHVGGNTWAGGTGGRDTAGLGGKGGPYRLDAGHDVHQLSQAEKDAVPEEVRRAAREMAQKAFKERLREIRMSEYDASLYEKLASGVEQQIRALRGILNSLQAKGKERQWLRHRTTGELDDTKLIEGLAGERNIYRQRREEEPEVGAPQSHPKRLRLVVDVSGSMYRFNGHDGRLERELEATLMVMEAFEGFENKFKYDIYGHSGEEAAVPLVDCNSVPRNNKERLDVLKTMQAHSQFCLSGDHTLEAAVDAVRHMATEESDESFVILLSDANLDRYGIRPSELTKALTAESTVNTYAIFIGSLGDQANRLTEALPAGRSFVCLDLTKLPQILQQIFTSAMLK
ncbi:von Willebrand factor A domain-containing protein 8-like isoform X2 [Homarus americanus]|uniref:von Willebrand factor A domain-containing protein 8-like isoform X2 n=1 Tax=Homarus americanus TaxID=6706 RepID=UPI001C44DEDE|nr:von Willebrand factor A domain-containing protein 8-like isoform X2 [Homarus americanus]